MLASHSSPELNSRPTPSPDRYPIEELAAEGDFIDSTFLLLHGELPSKQVRPAWLWLVGALPASQSGVASSQPGCRELRGAAHDQCVWLLHRETSSRPCGAASSAPYVPPVLTAALRLPCPLLASVAGEGAV